MEYLCKGARKITMLRMIALQGGNLYQGIWRETHIPLATLQNFMLHACSNYSNSTLAEEIKL